MQIFEKSAVIMVPSSDSPVGILVLGMHRSGTSAVTGVLSALGIPVPGELLPAAADNPKGFFENKASFNFNRKLLNHFNSCWDDPLAISLDGFVSSGLAGSFEDELAGLIQREFLEKASVFALKDPSLCRFLPIWCQAFSRLRVMPRLLLTLRHPVEVADSLSVREGFPRAKSFLVWLQHMLPAERQSRGIIRSFLPYDLLLSDWRSATDKLADELGLTYPAERARVEANVDAFLSRDLRHHVAPANFGEENSTTGLDALTARAWKAFQALAHDRDSVAAMAELDAVSATLDSAASIFGPFIAWEFPALLHSLERVALLEEIERVIRAENGSYFQTIAELNGIIEEQRKTAKTSANELAEVEKRANRAAEAVLFQHQELLAGERLLFQQRLEEAEQARAQAESKIKAYADARDAIENSTAWRLTEPFRNTAKRMPRSLRWHLRRLAKASWWVATPWRTPARLRLLRERKLNPVATGSTGHITNLLQLAEPNRGPTTAQPALGVFEVASGPPRVSMVTDSINEGSLFGGVATALIFTALFAKRTGRRLRIVTRTQAPAAENVAVLFRAHGIDWTNNIEFAFADLADPDNRIDTHEGELFVTTSWWTTRATRQSVADRQILYLLQEDERMFYPFGDEQLACAEILGDRAIAKIINSELLHRHLLDDAIIDQATPFFEPSFPSHSYFPSNEKASNGKYNFFFYARPNNARNLYDRGVAVIETAIERGILDPALWNIYFVGKDLTPLKLASGVEPYILQNLSWEDYVGFVQSVDLALTLMYTPHPSYPPLDVAACGGIAVTNRFGVKTDLSNYSRSILCGNSDVESLVEGLRLGVQLALDPEGRRQALADSGIKRDWSASFAPVLDLLTKSTPHVH